MLNCNTFIVSLLFDKVYDPETDPPPVMKIADFGLTKVGTNSLNPHVSGVLGTFVDFDFFFILDVFVDLT